MARPERIRIGEILVLLKLVTQEQVKLALDQQKTAGENWGGF